MSSRRGYGRRFRQTVGGAVVLWAAAACTEEQKELTAALEVDAGSDDVPPPLTAPLSLESARVIGAVVGDPFRHVFSAVGGVEPLTWQVDRPDVAGLRWAEDGPRVRSLVGTPAAVGPFDVNIKVEDREGQSAQLDSTFSVYGVLSFTVRELAEGTVGRPYAGFLRASPAAGGHRFELIGAAPPGLSFVHEGAQILIEGTPISTGTFTFDLRVSDAVGQSEQRAFALTVGWPPLRILASDSFQATGCRTFDLPLFASGGTGSGYTWHLVDASEDAVLRGTTATATLTAIVDEGPHTMTVQVEDSEGRQARRDLNIQAGPRDTRYAVSYVRAPSFTTHLIDLCHRQPQLVRSFEDLRPQTLSGIGFSEAPYRRWIYVYGALTSTTPGTYRIDQADPAGPLIAYGEGDYAGEQHVETSGGTYTFRLRLGGRPSTIEGTQVLFVPAGAREVMSTSELFPDRADRGITVHPIITNPQNDVVVQRWDNALLFATRDNAAWTFAGAVPGDVHTIGFTPEGRHFFALRDDMVLIIAVEPGRTINLVHQQSLGFTPPFSPSLIAGGRRMLVLLGGDRYLVYDAQPSGVGLLYEWDRVSECFQVNGFAEGAFRCISAEETPWKLLEWPYDAATGSPRELILTTPADTFLTKMHVGVGEDIMMAETYGPQQEMLAWTLTPTVALHRLTGQVGFIDPFAHMSPDRNRVAIAGGLIQDVELWIHDLSRLPEDSLLWHGSGDNLISLWRADGTGFMFGHAQSDSPSTWWLDFAFEDAPPVPRRVLEGVGILVAEP